jgi:hypothetical protein
MTRPGRWSATGRRSAGSRPASFSSNHLARGDGRGTAAKRCRCPQSGQAAEERGHDTGLVVGKLGGEVPPHAPMVRKEIASRPESAGGNR